ncbi:YbaK/EbsC family protein [Endozoicomonas sp. Mp262]|uniref:aminoacyl-tRNA deacylase n=1 Tax=Endozoicomonas sp. Mp262 TaxID=2919499 RepID=UPI0021D98930
MSISPRVNQFLNDQCIPFDTLQHSTSHSSVQSAIAAQIPLHSVAKAVILKDSLENYLMAVIPASSRVQVKQVSAVTATPLKMASEKEVRHRFSDCESGAIPPFGQVYNMEMIWDNRLSETTDLFMEAGDHQTLIHLTQQAFQQVVADTLHDDLCISPRHEE